MHQEKEFTTDWFTWNIPCITESMAKAKLPSTFKLLEIGSWEGRSTCWFFENYPSVHITCIDTFQGGIEHQGMDQLKTIEEKFYKNTEEYKDRRTVLKGPSAHMLFKAGEPESFDVIYVDGSHASWDALTDIVLSMQLLKKGGLMMIDDYDWASDVNDLIGTSPKPAVDAFLTLMRDKYQLIHFDYQCHFIKK